MTEFAYQLMDTDNQEATIKVIGIGGGGGNAVSHMITKGIKGVEFICANTDTQDLRMTKANVQLQIGINETKGLGSGSKPEIGRASAEEDRDRIASTIDGSNMLFIAAGLGGGTGTGACPVVAEIAQEKGILTVAVVNTPFSWEGEKRKKNAEKGIDDLERFVDSLIIIPNDKLQTLGNRTTVINGFAAANDVLANSVQGIAELITIPGHVNLDFADVRTVMAETGRGIIGMGSSSGQDRGREAVEAAIQSPLLEDIKLEGAKGILINITAGDDLMGDELEEIGEIIKGYASENAEIISGYVVDKSLKDSIHVTVVLTGLDQVLDTSSNGEKDFSGQFPELDKPITSRNKDLFEDLPVEGDDQIPFLDVPSFLKRNRG
ncbi:MAG: cell division protein FtsZ [Gammaproteobacteria bacterium]|nr:cell division protein FtsZ [Gammaproteobacteria bacterium]|tara:strand:+ start:868 stop:2001 length:1134 start_codon:yes stop_codon:yes gene_type:complete